MRELQQQMEPIDIFECAEPNRKNTNAFEDWNSFRNGTLYCVSPLETIIEEESPVRNAEDCSSENLLKRLKTLEEEYNELVIYTRDEENILTETTKRVEELEEQLKAAQATVLSLQNQQKQMEDKYKLREQELCDRVYVLEEQLGSEQDDIDVPYVLSQLLHLQEILSWSPKKLINNEVEKDIVDGNEKQDLIEKIPRICQENEQLNVVVKMLEKENNRLQIENADYQSTIVKHQSTINTLEEKLKFSELKAQRQKQLLTSAQEQISDLRTSLVQKERLICNNTKNSEAQLMYFDRCKLCDTTNSDLCKIISYFITEQKALLLVRHSQDQRNRYRSVIKKMKSNNTHLKKLISELQSQNCDFCKISDVLINSSSNLKEYYNLEKQFLNLQIEQLELANKAYLYEIMVLKDLKQDSKKHVCPHCA